MLTHSPSIVRDGLVLCLDAANSKSIRKRTSNLLSWNSWTLGSGSVTGYTQNGSTAENQRILDTNPFGNSDVVWDTPSNDVESGGDGGWDGYIISNIDPTKTYRWSTWVRRKVIGNGSFYLGCSGYDSSNNNVGVLNRSNGSVNTNPYFVASGWWGTANTWYLVVGHVWPTGSGTGSSHVDSGIYNTAGTKVTSAGDFVWQSTNVKTTLRSYLYYSTDTSTNQQWYHPRLDICDGSEPTISELLNNIENTWYDLSGNNNHGILTNVPIFNSDKTFIFDGINDQITTPSISLTDYTFELFVKATGDSLSGSTGYNTLLGYTGTRRLLYDTSGNLLAQVGTGNIYSNRICTRNVWNHVAFTYQSSNVTATWYINGSNAGSSSSAAQGTWNSAIYIGSYNSDNYWMNGSIANVKIYNRTLSAAEIAQNFAAYRGRYGL